LSISSTVRKAGPFAGNDAQTVFPISYKVFATSDVVEVRAEDGEETTLALGVDYTVTLNGDQDAAPGGDITLATALATGQTLAATSDVPALQSVTVTNAGGFFPAVFNGVFDRLTILVQQVLERIGRQFTVPLTATGVTDLTVPVTAGGVLQWSPDGSRLLAQSLPDLSLSLALPDQSGKAGQFLTTDGANPAWSAVDLTAYALKSVTISGGGLATGGGGLDANRTLTVTAAVAADVRGGADTTKAVTAGAMAGAVAFGALTDGSSVSWAITTHGVNVALAMAATGRVIGFPTGLWDGCPVTLKLVQPAGGGCTPVFNGNYEFTATPSVNTGASKVDYVFGVYDAARGKLVCNYRRAP
jgi:hypothetical protein